MIPIEEITLNTLQKKLLTEIEAYLEARKNKATTEELDKIFETIDVISKQISETGHR